MLKFKKTFLLPLFILALIFSCDLLENPEDNNPESSPIVPIEESSYSTYVSGYIYNSNIGNNGNHFDEAKILVNVDEVTTEYTVTSRSYNFSVTHSGSFDVEISTPNLSGYDTYTETIDTTESDLEKDFPLSSSEYYYSVSVIQGNINDFYTESAITNYSIISSAPQFEPSGSFLTFLTGDIFTYSIEAPGYITREYSKNIAESTDTGQHTFYINSMMYENNTEMTTISGYINFESSGIPVYEGIVNRNGDPYYQVEADSNGYYSFDVYHRGEFSIQYGGKGMYTSTEYFVTSESLVTHNQNVSIDTLDWGTVSGTIYKDSSNSEPLENAIVKLGDFTAITDNLGEYSDLYLYKGEDTALSISAAGYSTITDTINSWLTNVTLNYNMTDAGSSSGSSGGTSGGSSTPAYTGSVTITGSFTDSIGAAISGGSLTAGVDSGSVSGSTYNVTTNTTDGNVIIQSGMVLGYNLYSYSLKVTSANEVHDIVLTPTLNPPVSTTFTGTIKDSETGNVPSDLSQFTLSANAVSANINKTTGEYSVTVSSNTGAVIFQGSDGNNNYYILRRTEATSSSSHIYDVNFDPK